MSERKEMAILFMQAIISSKYMSDYAADGMNGFSGISQPEAIAKEAFKYARAFEKEHEADYRR